MSRGRSAAGWSSSSNSERLVATPETSVLLLEGLEGRCVQPSCP
jgi:hypothetical protein